MTKRELMGLVLPAIIGASVAFAQQPTLDKLKFVGTTAQAANKQISGAVVIPDTYNGKPVEGINAFSETGIIVNALQERNAAHR